MSGARSEAFVEVSVPEAYERFVMRQLFEPWARELLRRAPPRRGDSVLDVACGPGTVARLAAAAVGGTGRVTATDISAAMLAVAAARPPVSGAAPIEYLECSADALDASDGSFQLAVCQNGLQFFPDRPAAAREMNRVLHADGVALVSTWAAEQPLGLFGPIAEAMSACDVPEPYPRAFDPQSYALSATELTGLLETAGFGEVSVEAVELDCTWETVGEALSTVAGTPFGPVVAALPTARRERLRATLLELLGEPGEGPLSVRTASNIARGVKP